MASTSETVVNAADVEVGDVLVQPAYNRRVTAVRSIGGGSQIIIEIEGGEQIPGFSPRNRLHVVRESAAGAYDGYGMAATAGWLDGRWVCQTCRGTREVRSAETDGLKCSPCPECFGAEPGRIEDVWGEPVIGPRWFKHGTGCRNPQCDYNCGGAWVEEPTVEVR